MEPISPTLQAKKQERDAKRKQLEKMFQQHQQTEHKQLGLPLGTGAEQMMAVTDDSSAVSEVPSYLKASYQNKEKMSGNSAKVAARDIEQGDQTGDNNDKPVISNSYGGISSTDDKREENADLSMRTEIQSLIHNDSDDDPNTISTTTSTVLEKIESNPQRFLGAFLLILFMLWWL